MFNLPLVKTVPNPIACLALVVLTLCLGLPTNSSAKDLEVGHFGSTNYGDWKPTGTAFNSGPASADLLRILKIENARDNQVASSAMDGDGLTGTLTSPPFKIARKYVAFR